MNYLLLGAGLQGRAAIYALHQLNPEATIIVGDLNTEAARAFVKKVAIPAPLFIQLDASDDTEIIGWMEKADVVIDMLPITFTEKMAELAVRAGTHLVNTFYPGRINDLHETAMEKGVALLPEMGMDPGIDLVMARKVIDMFDEVTELRSFGAGFPERDACDNPLNYKISWTWEGVLKSYNRPARFIKDGKHVSLSATEVFEPEHVKSWPIQGIGALEAIANGDAVHYSDVFGLSQDKLKTMVRYSMRWPGHAAFWRTMHQLGFFETESAALPVSPFDFLVKHLGPRLQYQQDERDLGILCVDAIGRKDGEIRRVTDTLIDRRDLATGLYAMNRMVGFSAALTARMIAEGDITARGVLSPARDVPISPFLGGLSKFGMTIQHHSETLSP